MCKKCLTELNGYARMAQMKKESKMPNLTVVHENKLWIIRDTNENLNYGKYDTKEDAEAAKSDWELYFNN